MEKIQIAGLVSVIIPAYNHERYVRQAITSAIDQSYPEIELIVLDDGSPDGTWAAVSEMAEACRKRFRRFEMMRQENQGICPTLNRLLDAVHGEYVLRLDSDDLIKPHSIELLLNFLKVNPEYGLAVGDNEIIDENGQVVYWTRKRENTLNPVKAKYQTFGDFLRHLRLDMDFNSDQFGDYYKFIVGNYMPNGYLVRRSIMEQIRYTPEAPQEDHYLMLQVAKLSRMKFFEEILHSYRWHKHNNIKNRAKMWNFSRNTMRYELNLLKRQQDQERYRRANELLTRVNRKVKFRLGSFLEIYKESTYFERSKYSLRLGDRNFVLKSLKP